MKTRLKHAGKSTWAFLLILMIIASSFTVTAVSRDSDVNSSGASVDTNVSSASAKNDINGFSLRKGSSQRPSNYGTEFGSEEGSSTETVIDSKGIKHENTPVYTWDLGQLTKNTSIYVALQNGSDLYGEGATRNVGDWGYTHQHNSGSMSGFEFIKYNIKSTAKHYAKYYPELDQPNFKIVLDSTPLAESAELIIKKNGTEAYLGTTHEVDDFTATLRLKNSQVPSDGQYTITLNRGVDTVFSDLIIKASDFTTNGEYVEYTFNNKILAETGVGTYKFYINISTNSTDDKGVTYSSVNTEDNPKTVTISNSNDVYYYYWKGSDFPRDIQTITLTKAESDIVTIETNENSTGETYSIIFFDNNDVKSQYNISNFKAVDGTLSTASNKTSGLYTYYNVKEGSSANKLSIKFDSRKTGSETARQVWGVSQSTSADDGKTLEKDETVTYYFAEPFDFPNMSLNGDGVKIKYWNNSVSDPRKKIYFDIQYAQKPAAWNIDWSTDVLFLQKDTATELHWVKMDKYDDHTFVADIPEDIDVNKTDVRFVKKMAHSRGWGDISQGATNAYTLEKANNGCYRFKLWSDDPDNNDEYKYKGNFESFNDGHNRSTNYIKKVDVTETATVNGSNVIRVNGSQLYKAPFTDTKSFKVYKIKLPIWATSFAFCDNSGYEIQTDNCISDEKSLDIYKNNSATIALNPNRIYTLYQKNSTYYCRGIVLDEHLWNSSNSTNIVGTKTFKANAVNYDTEYNSNDPAIKNDINTKLSNKYGTTYKDPLYFGYFSKNEYDSLNNFTIWKNLAYRSSTTRGEESDERYYFASTQGLVSNKLSSGGNLLGSDGNNMKLFDYGNMNGYILSEYTNLKFPFNKSSFNGITTYSYDSTTDYNREISNSDFTTTTSYHTAPIGGNNGLGFFPFYQRSNTSDDYNRYYGYGVEFDIDFYMSSTGSLENNDGENEDISFNFSGDDDVWVYVDGVLALDLGGDHKISAGSINFTDMKVYYKTAVLDKSKVTGITDTKAVSEAYVKTVDLNKLLANSGVDFDNTDSVKKHTLQMFYMERGCLDSNCSISFNLPQTTSLKVENNIDFDGVNLGFSDIVKTVANNDYFTYSVQNQNASAEARTKEKNAFGNAVTEDNQTDFSTRQPLYPLYNKNNDVLRRIKIGEDEEGEPINQNYLLTQKSETDTGSQSSSYWNGSNAPSSLTDLANINYSLTDKNAVAVNSESDSDNQLVSAGKTDGSGQFSLLYGQQASFDYKVPASSIVKIQQQEFLGKGTGKDGEKQTVTKGGRSVQDYYTTSYRIIDNVSQAQLSDNTEDTKNNKSQNLHDAEITFNDRSGVLGKDGGFYFSNYSQDATASDPTSVLIELNYAPNTEKIIIYKSIANGDTSNASFKFKIGFKDVFGNTVDNSKYEELDNLVYKVYDIATGDYKEVLYKQKADEDGMIEFTSKQRVEIEGVPVDTKYQVTEVSQTGFIINSATADVENTKKRETDPKTGEVTKNDFIDIKASENDENGTINGTTPKYTDKEKGADPAVAKLTYVNKVDFAISFNYYDRKVQSGTVAQISTKPTMAIVDVTGSELDENKLLNNGSYDFEKLIGTSYSKLIKPSNVVDEYVLWESQKKAVDGISDTTNLHTNKTYSSTYDAKQLSSHTNCYGIPTTSEDADYAPWVIYNFTETLNCQDAGYDATGDGEVDDKDEKYLVKRTGTLTEMQDASTEGEFKTKVVYNYNDVYTNSDDEVIKNLSLTNTAYQTYNSKAEKDAALGKVLESDRSKVNGINVWLYNTLKEYTLTLYCPTDGSDGANPTLSTVSGKDLYYANSATNTKSFTTYYNVRIGKIAQGGGSTIGGSLDVNSNGEYLDKYGIKGVCDNSDIDKYVPETVEQGGKTLTFRYWSYDQGGQYIASTQRQFMYRITSPLKLYAIYSETDKDVKKDFGLTVYADRPDYYFDNTGAIRARLNTMLCPYNWAIESGKKDEHENINPDPNITKAALFYIIDETGGVFDEYISDMSNRNQVISDLKTEANKYTEYNLDNNTQKEVGQFIFYTKVKIAPSNDATTIQLVYDVKASDAKMDSNDVFLTNKNRVQIYPSLRLDALSVYKNFYTFGAMKYSDGWHISDNYVHYEFDTSTGEVKIPEDNVNAQFEKGLLPLS